MKPKPCLIIPKILPAKFVSNKRLSVLVDHHTVVPVRCLSRLLIPVTANCVPGLTLPFDHNVQVLMTSESFFCSGLQQAVYILSSVFDQSKSLFVLNFGGFLLNECKLRLRYREKVFDVIDKGGDVCDELF
jgi:hypothetical protein